MGPQIRGKEARATPVLRGRDVNQIRELYRQGLCISEIAVMTGYDRKSIRKYLSKPWREPWAAKRRRRRPSKLDTHKAYIEQRLNDL